LDLLERQTSRRVPQNEKKQLEAQIRSNWQVSSQWPQLLKGFLTLAENTLNQPEDVTSQSKEFFFKTLF